MLVTLNHEIPIDVVVEKLLEDISNGAGLGWKSFSKVLETIEVMEKSANTYTVVGSRAMGVEGSGSDFDIVCQLADFNDDGLCYVAYDPQGGEALRVSYTDRPHMLNKKDATGLLDFVIYTTARGYDKKLEAWNAVITTYRSLFLEIAKLDKPTRRDMQRVLFTRLGEGDE